MVMNGHHGQRIAIDRISRTVMVQTAVGPQGRWNDEFFEIFKVATRLS
jgi:hypothetical protein